MKCVETSPEFPNLHTLYQLDAFRVTTRKQIC